MLSVVVVVALATAASPFDDAKKGAVSVDRLASTGTQPLKIMLIAEPPRIPALTVDVAAAVGAAHRGR